MNFWEVMNVVAWGLSALFACLILSDFIKTERGKKSD